MKIKNDHWNRPPDPLLMEMYDQDEDKVIKILSISDNGMRTLKSRTRPVD